MKIYSTPVCPNCRLLKMKMAERGIAYEEISDTELMKEKGFLSVPMVEANGKTYTFREALEAVKKGEFDSYAK